MKELRILTIHHQDNMKINRRIWRLAVKVSMEMQSKEDLLPRSHSKIMKQLTRKNLLVLLGNFLESRYTATIYY